MEWETYPKHICFWKLGIFFWRLLLVMMTMMKMFLGDELFSFSTLGAPDRQKGDSAGLGMPNSEHLIFFFIFEATFSLLTILDYTRAYFIDNKSFLWSFALIQPKTCMKLWFSIPWGPRQVGVNPNDDHFSSHVWRKFSSSLCRGATFRPGTTQKTGVGEPKIAFGLEGYWRCIWMKI